MEVYERDIENLIDVVAAPDEYERPDLDDLVGDHPVTERADASARFQPAAADAPGRRIVERISSSTWLRCAPIARRAACRVARPDRRQDRPVVVDRRARRLGGAERQLAARAQGVGQRGDEVDQHPVRPSPARSRRGSPSPRRPTLRPPPRRAPSRSSQRSISSTASGAARAAASAAVSGSIIRRTSTGSTHDVARRRRRRARRAPAGARARAGRARCAPCRASRQPIWSSAASASRRTLRLTPSCSPSRRSGGSGPRARRSRRSARSAARPHRGQPATARRADRGERQPILPPVRSRACAVALHPLARNVPTAPGGAAGPAGAAATLSALATDPRRAPHDGTPATPRRARRPA